MRQLGDALALRRRPPRLQDGGVLHLGLDEDLGLALQRGLQLLVDVLGRLTPLPA